MQEFIEIKDFIINVDLENFLIVSILEELEDNISKNNYFRLTDEVAIIAQLTCYKGSLVTRCAYISYYIKLYL